MTLAQTAYGHFYIEHNRGHHVRVATPEDPRSSRFGETFWEFLPRSVWGSARSAVKLEAARIPARQEPWDPRTWLGNDVLNAWLMTVVLFGALIACLRTRSDPLPDHPGGVRLLDARVGQLPRALRTAAAEERERPLRALHPAAQLNSDHWWTNLFLYHLQRHSDHHANPNPALPDAAQHG